MSGSRLIVIALAVACTVASASGQAREAAFGSVTGPEGKPLANAVVQFAYVPIGHEAEAAADAPSVISDERGRFRVELLPATAYRAWAIGPADADGRHAVSPVTWTWASNLLELRAEHRLTACAPLLSPGELQKWPDLDITRVRLLPDSIELPQLTLPLDEHGQAAPTAIPIRPLMTWVEYLDADGTVLDRDWITSFVDRLPGQMRTPPGQTLTFQVTDGQGEVLAGVEISQRTPRLSGNRPHTDALGLPLPDRIMWRRLGVTDAAGRLTAPVVTLNGRPDQGGWSHVVFRASKPGFATTLASPFELTREHWQADGAVQLITLNEARPFVATLLGRDGKPLANAEVTVRTPVPVYEHWQNERSTKLQWRARTDDDGQLTIAELPRGTRVASLDIDGIDGPPFGLHTLSDPAAHTNTIDLSHCRELQLNLVGDADTPACDAAVLLLSLDGQSSFDEYGMRAVPDRAGRITVRLQRGPWLVFAANETHAAFQVLEVARPETLEITLMPMTTMAMCTVDENGKPIPAGLKYESTRAEPGAEQAMLEIAELWNIHRINRCLSGADGNLEVRFLSAPHSQTLVHAHAVKRLSPSFELRAVDGRMTVTLQ